LVPVLAGFEKFHCVSKLKEILEVKWIAERLLLYSFVRNTQTESRVRTRIRIGLQYPLEIGDQLGVILQMKLQELRFHVTAGLAW
jgi:hypothetical protein